MALPPPGLTGDNHLTAIEVPTRGLNPGDGQNVPNQDGPFCNAVCFARWGTFRLSLAA